MKKLTLIITFLAAAFCIVAQTTHSVDTTFHYNNRSVVVNEKNDEINVSVYRQNAQEDTIKSEKIYEGIFTDNREIERRYESNFEISIPGIFKPKNERLFSDNSHWGGFGVGFTNLPNEFDFNGQLASTLNLSRSLQYNLNFGGAFWRFGKSNYKGMIGLGIQFNSFHLQTNKAIKIENYRSEIFTTQAGQEYNKSRLHYTYLTLPFLVETNFPLGKTSDFFVNAGVVAKVKTASSSKVWFNEDGKEKKMKMPGELNIRPLTFDLLVQAGIDNIGVFASYSPLSVFLNNKGPRGNQATVGLQLYF
ncbi:MAG: outer membrane beta-barrel protein [Bacteroidia bacterium]|nr:outer membrane beta-barrel protein [Bacteroidia bacterium]